MISRILIAIEDMYFMPAIESFISQLESKAGAVQLKILHVVEPETAVYSWPSAEYRRDAEALVCNVCKILSDKFPQYKVEGQLREGIAKEEIIEEARAISADLILMGPHGRKGIGKFLMGSVAKDVIPLAPCSVVLLRQDKEHKQSDPVMSAQSKGTAAH